MLGIDEGIEDKKEAPDMMLAEQINMLLIELKRHMHEESYEKYVLWNAISKLNSEAMLNRDKAAHKKQGE